VEIDGCQNLPELLGRNLLVAVTVPVLEKALYIESGCDAELLESVLKGSDAVLLAERVVFATVAVVEIERVNGLTGV